MMKRFIYIIFMMSGLCSYGQIGQAEAPPENRFKQSEEAASTDHPYNNDTAGLPTAGDPGNPGDPQPIDGPLPLLAAAALALIIYTVYKKKQIKST